MYINIFWVTGEIAAYCLNVYKTYMQFTVQYHFSLGPLQLSIHTFIYTSIYISIAYHMRLKSVAK